MAGRRPRQEAGPRVGALLLAPGAGSSAQNPCLVAIETAVAPMPVQRMDFPYRKAGRKAPDRPPVLLAAVRDEAEALVERAGVAPDRLALGGRSMGGRMCSMAVADGLPAAALVLISYPLHPPGRPDALRTAHLPQLHVPCLFVHGTRDPFGAPGELEEATATIPGPVTHVWIDGGRHDLKGADARVAATVAEWLASLR
jgi:predicted alpha/beta-hydrolase family hydrolase